MERIDFSKGLHPESLERLCVRALAEGDFESAFMYADRRCRIVPLAKAHHYTLRAEALERLGEREAAVNDLAAAIEIAPDDLPANRRMLTWGHAPQRLKAARTLVAQDRKPEVVTDALSVLRRDGCCAAGSLHRSGDAIVGWTAWDGADDIVATVTCGSDRQTVAISPQVDSAVPTGGFENVASFEFERPATQGAATFELALRGAIFCSLLATASVAEGAKQGEWAAISGTLNTPDITVIVPIYRDFVATRDCLEGLRGEIGRVASRRAILVNDASPDAEIAELLASYHGVRNFATLTNTTNLGFAASVNRALERINGGDIVLLNADTIVPPQFLERMAAIARSDHGIGTITPLSNNGEFTSFPLANQPNPLPCPSVTAAIDEAAAQVNAGKVIDIPNGIGFCLYITRRCLEAVASLSENFQRGYLEDVDFCLRASEQGFRNVCATSIYVGHHGSRSFLTDKRALVVHNLGTIESRFPDYRRECAVYLAADPLRPAREALELALLRDSSFERLIVCGQGLVEPIVVKRAEGLSARGQATLVMLIELEPSGYRIRLKNAASTPPQSLTFQIARARGYEVLRGCLQSFSFDRIELADPAGLPIPLMDMLRELGKPLDLFIADAGLVCPRGTLLQDGGEHCRDANGLASSCNSCRPLEGGNDGEYTGDSYWRRYWRSAVDAADRLLVPCRRAQAFASVIFPGKTFVLLDDTTIDTEKLRDCRPEGQFGLTSHRVGIVPQGQSVAEFKITQTLLHSFVQRRPDLEFVVLGASLDDLALMALGNVFVTGAMTEVDYADAFRCYRLARAILPLRRPLFGHPAGNAARASGLPLAYFDWSFGRSKAHPHDMPLDPRWRDDEVADALERWLAG